MALTDSELQTIVNSVLSSIRTNSRTIDQLSSVSSLTDSDVIEIGGGKKITYAALKNLNENQIKTILKVLIAPNLESDAEKIPSSKAVYDFINNRIVGEVSLSNLDNVTSSNASQFYVGDVPCRYIVFSGAYVVGILSVFSDSMHHVVTQVFTTHYVLVNGSFGSSHSDTKIFTYYRSYSVNSPNIPSGTWSAWKKMEEAFTGFFECSTLATTAAKTITINGFTLDTNCRLVVKMTYSNTAANATLNIDSTGAKPLFYNGERASASNYWEAGEVLDIYYDGANFQASNFQGGAGEGGNMILTFTTDVATTRKLVKTKLRKAGLAISYEHPEKGWITEQYIGTTFTDAQWQLDANWQNLATAKDITDGIKGAIISHLVKGDIVETCNLLINKINPLTDYIIGFRLGASGEEIASADSVTSKFIDVSNIEKFYTGAYAYGSILGYDRDFKFVKVLQSNGEFDGSYVVDQNVQYIRLSFVNQSNYKRIFLYTDEAYLSQKTNIFNATYHEYGITSTDLKHQKELDVIPSKMDDYHTLYMNSLNMFIEDMIQERGYALKDDGINTVRSAAWWYTKYIPVTEGCCISSNLPASGNIFFYDRDKKYMSKTVYSQEYGRWQDSVVNGVVPEGACYMRISSNWNMDTPFFNISREKFYRFYPFGEVLDLHYKYRNKKLVTIGDSITYQATWQERLCELTGMWYKRKEIRGDNEAVKTEGYGYIKLGAGDVDTDDYFETVEGITKTSETIVDGFGYAHPVWKDASGNRYRQPCRMAEGGETVMPVNSTSIYSRAADSKYYKGDVIIVFAGANDKVSYVDGYPTVGSVKDKKGLTNYITEEADSSYEIYTEDKVLESVGDYVEEGVTTGVKRYNHTFRACFRGMMKKIVDANPNAEIIVIGPFATFVKASPYTNAGYDYLARNLNAVIKDVAREFSCRYIDLYPLFGRYNADRFFGGSDGTVFVHPGGAGGKKIADYIHSQLC